MKVFLGGTCNDSEWREDLIRQLEIDYFNPVVDDWDEEARKREIQERESCDFCLYCITPKMTGVYAIAEVVDDSNKRPSKTIFCFVTEDGNDVFTDVQIRSLKAVAGMVESNGVPIFRDLMFVAAYLNGMSA